MTDARDWGVQDEYHDTSGGLVRAGGETVAAALHALGADEHGAPPPPRALILHPGDPVPAPLDVLTEDRRPLHFEGSVPGDAPLGYHIYDADGEPRPLVISPGRCHLPGDLRLGGWALQLYSARSWDSWGIGDLADLRAFGSWASAGGAGFVLLSPLNAVTLTPPIEPSPYLPSSRRWRNPLYLRVEDVPGGEIPTAPLQALASSGRALNDARLIDRAAVAHLKLNALAQVAEATPPSDDFHRWRSEQGVDLERFAVFSTLAEQHGVDFRRWPAELQDGASPAVQAAAARASGRVQFHAWLQWLLDRQLRSAAGAVPLVTDLPIGVDPGGADVWADPALFARDFSVGAPADDFNVLGQDWAQPPWNPWQLRARGYEPLVRVLRSAFSHAMGLRIDHIMGLFRLFWIPRGGSPHDGVYVRYPASDILDILALESARAGAIVVGEDLGTVEPEVREQMAARDILSYRLLWFEESPAERFPHRAMAAVTTHDLPTIAGLWTGEDTAAQLRIGLPVNHMGTHQMRSRLARAAMPGYRDKVDDVITGAYTTLAGAPSMLVAAALEDAALVTERPNMPGTTTERWPNWSLALPTPLEDVLSSPLASRLAAALRRRPA